MKFYGLLRYVSSLLRDTKFCQLQLEKFGITLVSDTQSCDKSTCNDTAWLKVWYSRRERVTRLLLLPRYIQIDEKSSFIVQWFYGCKQATGEDKCKEMKKNGLTCFQNWEFTSIADGPVRVVCTIYAKLTCSVSVWHWSRILESKGWLQQVTLHSDFKHEKMSVLLHSGHGCHMADFYDA